MSSEICAPTAFSVENLWKCRLPACTTVSARVGARFMSALEARHIVPLQSARTRRGIDGCAAFYARHAPGEPAESAAAQRQALSCRAYVQKASRLKALATAPLNLVL